MKVCVETDITRCMRKNVPRRVAFKDKVLARMKALGCSLSGSGLRRTPGGLTFPLAPFLSPAGGEEGGDGNLRTFPQPPHLPSGPPPGKSGAESKNAGTPHAMVARVRYMTDEKSGFFDAALPQALAPGHDQRYMTDEKSGFFDSYTE